MTGSEVQSELPAKAKSKTATTKAKTKAKSASKSKTKKVSAFTEYEALLKRAREDIPPEVFEQPRFQIPRVDSFIQGTRTVIRNFKDVIDTLRRDPTHLLRYLSHELATAGEIRGRQAMFNGRFNTRALNELIEKYTHEYVLCPICNRPDTEIKRDKRLLILQCSACGGRTPLKG